MVATPVEEAYDIRAWYGGVQEIRHDGGPVSTQPLGKAWAGVVFRNPLAGRWTEDLDVLMRPSAALGAELGRRAAGQLGGRPVESYGKGGVAGLRGEQEHVVACITTVFGDAFREAVGGGHAWISSATKSGGPGCTLDVPLAFKDEVYVRSHYDALTVTVPDGPRPDELLVVVVVASGARIHHRVGGMSREEALAGRQK